MTDSETPEPEDPELAFQTVALDLAVRYLNLRIAFLKALIGPPREAPEELPF